MNTAPEGILSEAGATTQNTVHSVTDLDTPIHTGTQQEKSSPSPKLTKIRMIYNQQYKIVHNDTSDLHQHSVNSEWRHNSQHTPPRGQPSHTNPGPTKPCTDIARNKQKTEPRIRGLSKKYPTFGGEKYISYVTGLGP